MTGAATPVATPSGVRGGIKPATPASGRTTGVKTPWGGEGDNEGRLCPVAGCGYSIPLTYKGNLKEARRSHTNSKHV